MTYRILYYLVNFLLRVFYKRIHFNGIENIPKDKPILIVCNHPNGFFEPIIMACLFPIDLHFLVRGDLFENKYLRRFLVSTHQIPIYRFKDGIAALRNNQKTINKAIEILRMNKAVLIFAEGSTNAGWQIRELKKGMSRMAFQCIDGHNNLNLHILPVGMTFYRSENPGTEMLLNVGKPFAVKDFYTHEPKEAKLKMDEMNLYTQQRLEELTLSVPTKEEEDKLRTVWQNKIQTSFFDFLPRVKKNTSLFNELKALIGRSKVEVNVIKAKPWYAVLLWILAIPGIIIWGIPVATGLALTKKYVKQREFVSSLKLVFCAVLCLILTIAMFTTIWIVSGYMTALYCFVISILLGFLSIAVWEYHAKFRSGY